jgi:NNP family nitrate/nitrite transporter-like MFS transporter
MLMPQRVDRASASKMTTAKVVGTPRSGLIGATTGFFVAFAAMAVFGPTAHCFAIPMHLSPLKIGLLVAAPALSGSLLRIPFAAWSDRVGARKPFLILLGLSIAAMLGLFVAVEVLYPRKLTPAFFPVLFALGVMCGCGIATFSVGASQVSYWYSAERQGTALGTYAGLGNMAPGIFSLGLPLSLTSIGLSGVYLAWLFFLVGGAVVYAVAGRDAWYFQLITAGETNDSASAHARSLGQEIFPTHQFGGSLLRAATRWRTWALVALYFVSFGGFLALTAWMPTYWHSYFGSSVETAGALTALLSLLASVVRFMSGPMCDRRGGARMATFALLVLVVGAVLIAHAVSYSLAIAGTIVVAVALGVNNAAVFKMVPHYVPDAIGGAAGLVGGLGALGGFVLPPMMALMALRSGPFGYATGIEVFAWLAIGGLVITTILRRSERFVGGAAPERKAA